MNRALILFAAVVAWLGASFAATAGSGLPAYPNAVNRNPDLPVGSPVFQLETTDAESTVDAWYGAHLAKSCRHEVANGPGSDHAISASRGEELAKKLGALCNKSFAARGLEEKSDHPSSSPFDELGTNGYHPDSVRGELVDPCPRHTTGTYSSQ